MKVMKTKNKETQQILKLETLKLRNVWYFCLKLQSIITIAANYFPSIDQIIASVPLICWFSEIAKWHLFSLLSSGADYLVLFVQILRY